MAKVKMTTSGYKVQGNRGNKTKRKMKPAKKANQFGYVLIDEVLDADSGDVVETKRGKLRFVTAANEEKAERKIKSMHPHINYELK